MSGQSETDGGAQRRESGLKVAGEDCITRLFNKQFKFGLSVCDLQPLFSQDSKDELRFDVKSVL